ncbi:MAG: hypothetical protein KKC72_18245, partial [Alphaproteobacteria bacterium]|nr:hypothetical protein [Alphaproteobacteria bacterium]MBU1834723.1 hypothetical protein [Alphaproteobacteria bacterium]
MRDFGDSPEGDPSRRHVELFNRLTKQFKEDAVSATIAVAVAETLAWLKANKESYRFNGDVASEPWWPTPPKTDNPILLEERGRALRARAFEHGLLRLLNLLKTRDVFSDLGEGDAKSLIIEIGTDPMTDIIVREMEKGRQAGPQHESVNLTFLRGLFKYSPTVKPAKVRDKRLRPLATLGLVTVRFDGSEYSVKSGVVAIAFYEKVYFP